jgi:lytic cellulose monooxygenase (C1-hydroxylating)
MGQQPQRPRHDVSSIPPYPVATHRPTNQLTRRSYLAHCPNDNCKAFKGDTGNIWVKIDQLAYNPSANPPWASDLLRVQGAKWTVTIPQKLAPGEYLLRHEILGLHVADNRMGAQFYPSCTQIRVTQGGTVPLPEGAAFPGAYDPADGQGVSCICLS